MFEPVKMYNFMFRVSGISEEDAELIRMSVQEVTIHKFPDRKEADITLRLFEGKFAAPYSAFVDGGIDGKDCCLITIDSMGGDIHVEDMKKIKLMHTEATYSYVDSGMLLLKSKIRY